MTIPTPAARPMLAAMGHRGLSPRLQSARDLLAKLEHDLERVRRDRRDVYAAFDFFVTAEHLGEWPPSENGLRHPHRGDSSGLLRLVCHLANGSKHFTPRAMEHWSVVQVSERDGGFDPEFFDPEAFDVGALQIEHLGFGDHPAGIMEVDLLAGAVVDFWRQRVR